MRYDAGSVPIKAGSYAPKKIDWGFDLMEFKEGAFEDILKRYGLRLTRELKDAGTDMERTYFVWSNPAVSITTTNNPVTGEYQRALERAPEKGYAGYVGITGNEGVVKNLVKDIKRGAKWIKDESKFGRDFV
jgi:hypothetical protein